jgi:1-acyl-sn-glycerol-3-phosphate acyltransferase
MIRSTIFNIAFYVFTALACIFCLPCLLLPKKKALVAMRIFVHGTHFLEKHIIGLDYEVRGREHLPKSGSYIVAAKHESPYETTKLNIVFDDPAIVLKRELLRIPLWGRFLALVEPIAIDRSAGKEAMTQIIEGARRVKAQNRPIVIFPQGTRVYTWQTPAEKPYKPGAARIAAEVGLPIIPMALNSGMYWPRKSWIKHPGRVVFEFLPPLNTAQDVPAIMKELEAKLEAASNALHREAAEKYGVPAKASA